MNAPALLLGLFLSACIAASGWLGFWITGASSLLAMGCLGSAGIFSFIVHALENFHVNSKS